MKSHLISKLQNLILIPVVALTLNTKAKDRFGAGIDFNLTQKQLEKMIVQKELTLEPYLNWKQNFKPDAPWQMQASPSRYNNHEVEKNITTYQAEPYLYFGRFKLGVPISTSSLSKGVVKVIEINWWDIVTLSDVVFKEKAPYGATMQITVIKPGDYFTKSGVAVRFQFMTSRYSLVRRDYIGHDVINGGNWSEVFRENTIYEGKSNKFQCGIYINHFSDVDRNFNVHYGLGYNIEQYGKEYSLKGFYFSVGLGF